MFRVTRGATTAAGKPYKSWTCDDSPELFAKSPEYGTRPALEASRRRFHGGDITLRTVGALTQFRGVVALPLAITAYQRVFGTSEPPFFSSISAHRP